MARKFYVLGASGREIEVTQREYELLWRYYSQKSGKKTRPRVDPGRYRFGWQNHMGRDVHPELRVEVL
jgi:hypothetical protein